MNRAIFAALFVLLLQDAPPPPPPPPPPPLPPAAAQIIVNADGTIVSLGAPAEPIVQNGGGVIDGSVKLKDGTEPLRDVQVTLSTVATGTPPVTRQLSTITDSSGVFVFKDLPDGRYTVRVQRDNYFGAPANGNYPTIVTTPAVLDSATRAQHLTFDLLPGGTISGTVMKVTGEPSTNVTVAAMRMTYRDGRRTLGPTKQVQTDDHGEYRLWGLAPGDYYIRSGVGIGARGGSSATYFPGTSDAELATLVTIHGGDETKANLRSQPSTPIHISGRIVNTIPDLTSDFIGILLMPHDLSKIEEGTSGSLNPNEATDRSNGQFQITATRSGIFDLMPVVPIRRSPTDPPLSPANGNPIYYTGRTTIEILNNDITDVTVTVTKGADLEVRVTSTSVPPATLKNFRPTLRPFDFVSTPLTTHLNLSRPLPDDGILKFGSVPFGKYVFNPQIPVGAYISEIKQGEQSVLDSGIVTVDSSSPAKVEIVLSNNGGRIEGIVEAAETKPAGSVRVILVPQGPRQGNPIFYKRAALINKNQFTISDVAPGSYKLYATENWPPNAEENAEFISKYEESGRAITVKAGSSETNISLTLTRLVD